MTIAPDDTLQDELFTSTVNTGQYLLHGLVLETGANPSPDNKAIDSLIRRQAVRFERILEAHGGIIVERLSNGLVAKFADPQSALEGACEMQRRCASTPAVGNLHVALKVGIQCCTDPLSDAIRDMAAKMAARLASSQESPGIVVGALVAEHLPDTLKASLFPINLPNLGMRAFVVDWDTLPMLRTLCAEDDTNSQATGDSVEPGEIVLRQGARAIHFEGRQAVVTIGRDSDNDLTVNHPKVSRRHCRIIFRAGSYVLVDLSTNGTFVGPEAGEETRVHKSMTPLSGRGYISFGQQYLAGATCSFEFEIKLTDH